MTSITKLAALASCSAIVLASAAPASAQQTVSDAMTDTGVIVVRGFRDSLGVARDIARESDNLVDVLAAEDVGKLPDTNIAEALNRLNSVYLRPDQGEGRYVSIRGVDPILNNVTLNGQTIAVSDTDGRSGRAAPLDVLSSGSLSRVEVFKVTLPNMDGQSIGGTINIRTPSAYDYDGRYATISAELGYNDFGTDSDIYAVSGAFGDTFGARDQFALFVSGEYWFKQYLSQLYENPEAATIDGFPDDFLFPDRVRFGSAIGERERYGASANLEYRPSVNTMAWARYFFTEYTDMEVRPEFTIRRRGDLGANSLNEFYFTQYSVEDEVRVERQERPVHQIVIGGERWLRDNLQITGNLNYTTAKEVNPYLNYYETDSRTSAAGDEEAPAITFSLDEDGFARPIAFNTGLSDGLTFQDAAFHQLSRMRQSNSNVSEETYTANADLLWDTAFAGTPVQVKTGLKYLSRDKTVDDNDARFPYVGDTITLTDLGSSFETMERGRSYDIIPGLSLPVPDMALYEAYRSANPDLFAFDAAGSHSNSIEDDYDLSEEIFAGYAMADFELTPSFSLIAGARVEATEVDVSAFSFVNSVTSDTDIPDGRSRLGELPFTQSEILDISRSHSYVSVLPALVTRWEIGANWLARASVTTNIGRPDYPDTAPISTLSVSEVYVAADDAVELNASNSIGNPDLEPYYGVNFDASLDYYFPDNTGAVTVGGFYKRVDNAIYGFREEAEDFEFEGVVYDTYVESTVQNADAGHIAGLELSVQKDFVELPAPLNGFGAVASIALIDSEVEISTPGREGESVPFFNQADTIFSAQLYYERGGFSARVAYAYQSEAIFDSLAGDAPQDIYRAPRDTVDAKITYTLPNKWRLSLTGSNLTNEPDLTYRNGDTFFIAQDPGYELYGREFRLGVSKTW